MIELNLIRFAFNKGDNPKYIILNEKHYDGYISGEDGYGCFEYMGDVTIEENTLREIIEWYEDVEEQQAWANKARKARYRQAMEDENEI